MSNNRILITQSSLRAIGGGELSVLELAIYLNDQGWEVVVYAWYLGGGAKSVVEQYGIKVLTPGDEASRSLRLGDFDYVWVFNQVLPQSIVTDLQRKRVGYPKFLFTHLSVLDSSPIDLPFVHDLENRLSSATLFRAEDAKARYADTYFKDAIPLISTYNNPAPVEFSRVRPIKRTLKKILVVVSNPAGNIRLITEMLQAEGYIVDTLDKNSTQPQIITAAILEQYDLVLSSAKTTQYCLCAGIPIYIMDMFGSLGYLNAKNLKKATKYNFSGNVQDKDNPDYRPNVKSERTIVKEIVEQYQQARDFQRKNRQKFIEQFSIDFVVPKLLKAIPERKITPFDQMYTHYVRLTQSMIAEFIDQVNGIYPERLSTLEARIALELGELAKARSEIARLSSRQLGVRQLAKELLRSIRQRLADAMAWQPAVASREVGGSADPTDASAGEA